MNLRTQTERLESMRDEITAWMKQKRSEVPIPVYGSVDVRDAGWKIGVVDANHFPAGFNNVSKENLAELSTLFKDPSTAPTRTVHGSTSTPKVTPATKATLRTSPPSRP